MQAAAEEKQDSQPHVTLDDAHGYAVEAFGPDAAITQKIGAVADLTDRYTRDEMPLVRAVISAEFERHAQGMAIPEWDAANPGPMEGPGAGFLKFLRSSTPESLRVTLESLPVRDTGSALFSSPAPDSSPAFGAKIDAILDGTYDMSRPVHVAYTPAVLRLVGAKALPISMPPSVVVKAIQEKHDLSPDIIKQLPVALNNPVFIFDSETVPNALTVILDLSHQGSNVLVAVHLDKKQERHVVNSIASIYGKSNPGSLENWMKHGMLRYIHTQKGRDWFQSKGLQLPEEGTPRGNRNLRTENDLVNPEGGSLMSSPTSGEFSFNQTTDAGDKSQKGCNFDSLPPGPNAKFIENSQKAYDNATTDKARENIAEASAKREGLSRGKVQNVPQGMMVFGKMSIEGAMTARVVFGDHMQW